MLKVIEEFRERFHLSEAFLESASSSVKAAEDRVNDIRLEIEDAEAEMNRLLTLEGADHVKRLTTDTGKPEEKPKRITRIRNLRDLIENRREDLVSQKSEYAAEERIYVQAMNDHCALMLQITAMAKHEVLEGCRAEIVKIADAMAHLEALQAIENGAAQDALGGIQVSFNAVKFLFSGAVVADRFFNALPPRLREMISEETSRPDVAVLRDEILAELRDHQ